jgi:GNAT superfamily N-acetyltransferase
MNPDNIWIREVVSIQDPALEQAIQLYQSSFPASECISPDAFRKAVQYRAQGREQRGKNAHFLTAQQGDEVIGMAYCRYFERTPQGEPLHLGYLLYLAVEERYRGLGIGAHFYQALTATLQTDAIYRGGELSGILYEVERPELAGSEAERTIRQRRIAFYERYGAHVLQGIDYIQPAVSDDQYPVPLYLMYHPLTRDFTAQQLCAWFYELVFGIKKP